VTHPLTGGLQFTIANGTGPAPTPVLIPQGTQVSTLLIGTPIIFETVADLWIYGDSVTTTINATGTGQANQQYYLGDTTGTIPWPTYNFTGGSGNQSVTVGGTTWTLAPSNSFVGVPATGAASQVYTIVNGNTMLFGNGTNGQNPANAAAIVITYQPAAPSNYTGLVAARHGQSTLGENIGVSAGIENQAYSLFNTPVVDGTVKVYVDEGAGPNMWTYHQRIIDAFSSEAAYTLAVDANGRFDLETAIAYAKMLRQYPLFWYEEAGDPLDYQLQATLADFYPGPMATGENLFSHQDARNLLRYGGMRPDRDWLQFDCALSYGLVEFRRTLAALTTHGWSWRRVIPHGGHQMSLMIAAGLGLGGNESYPDLFQPYCGFPDGVTAREGYVTLPDLPGIGFEGKSDLAGEMAALAA